MKCGHVLVPLAIEELGMSSTGSHNNLQAGETMHGIRRYRELNSGALINSNINPASSILEQLMMHDCMSTQCVCMIDELEMLLKPSMA
jgi:hypothetical protein